MASRKKSKRSPVVLRDDGRRLVVVSDAVTRIVCTFFHCAAFVLCCWFIYLAVESLAGKKTDARILFQAITDLKVNQWVAYIFGAGGVTYGYVQKRLRQSTVARLQDRVQKFESELDPDRSSSGLPTTGSTRKGD
jgi:hypothetical protein